jgi:hypothetical protein
MTNTPESDDAAIERLAATPTPDWRAALADLAIDTAEWQPAQQADETGRARS